MKVAPRWPRELPDGYVIRFNGREIRLTADEAMKLSEAVNDLFSQRMDDLEFSEGVEIADAIESAWAGMEAPEKELTESLASDLRCVLNDEVVRDEMNLRRLRDAL